MKAEAARPIKAEKHLWYQYKGKKAVTVKDTKGALLTLKPGDLFGLQNLTNKIDRVALPSRPDIRYMLSVETSSDLLDMSKRHREPVVFEAPPPKPIKVKVRNVMKPAKSKPENDKADRLAAIKKAATQTGPKPIKVEIPSPKPKKKSSIIEFDEDTFADHDDVLWDMK